ncbi:MAG: 16S rRNA (uracil(1498)-N(3))-methyltransferase [Clostridia bacterium]|nr:16S rRNA (uracil(1498)-N(3))-methyltransferase [Clostridia bacterium]
MHRFIVRRADGFSPDETVELPREEAQHAVKVLRLREGDRIELLDGVGGAYAARIARADRDGASAVVCFRLPERESLVRLTLYMGLPKAEKLEFIAQKLTELGAIKLAPVIMARSVSRPDGKDGDKRRERLERIALEAAKQCGRGYVPEMAAPVSWKAALPAMAAHELMLLPWEEAQGLRLGDVYAAFPGARDIALLIGPEGGIAPEEAHEAEAQGARLVTLGPRILRAETAAVASAAAVMALWGDL